MRIANILRKVLRRLVPNNSVEKALGVDICESGVMQNVIELWHNMYKNEPPWRGGKDNVIPLNLPSAISEEFARLILTEFSMKVTGSPMADFINEQLKDQLTDLNKFVEMYCEGGAIAVKPFVTNIDENGKPTAIELDFVKAVDFFPCAFNNKGEITAAVFVEGKKIGDYLYTRLEYHELTGMTYTIINKAFKSEEIYQYRDTIGTRKRNYNNEWKPLTLENHRQWQTLVHPRDIAETKGVVAIGNITKVYNEEQKFPEMNAYCISKLYADWTTDGAKTAHSEVLTEENVLTVFDEMMKNMDNKRVPRAGRILYVTPDVRTLINNAKQIYRTVDVGSRSDAIKRAINSIDDVKIPESVPSDMMKTKYDFTEGWKVDSTAKQINMVLVHPAAVITPISYEFAQLDPPSAGSQGKYDYFEESFEDVFILPHKMDAIDFHVSV